jgi:Plavaka transposase
VNIQDVYFPIYDRAASAATLTHCKWDLYHGLWELFLDEKFMHAYKHGIVIRFADGILRRVFPRILTYSADYPEK